MNRKDPNFFIVGAAKCGTSSLSDYINQHPEVYISPVKEPYYFLTKPEIENIKEYLQLFSSVKSETAIGEATTGYLFDSQSAQLLHRFDSNAQIIIVLRNPIDMAFSLWRYMSVNGNEKMSFLDACNDAPNRRHYKYTQNCIGRPENYLYIERASFFHQVKRYIEIFGKANVQIIIFERFTANPLSTCQQVFHFLHVSERFTPVFKVVNRSGTVRFKLINKLRSKKYPRLKQLIPLLLRKKIRQFLRDFNVKPNGDLKLSEQGRSDFASKFAQDVAQLKSLIGDQIPEWKDFA